MRQITGEVISAARDATKPKSSGSASGSRAEWFWSMQWLPGK